MIGANGDEQVTSKWPSTVCVDITHIHRAVCAEETVSLFGCIGIHFLCGHPCVLNESYGPTCFPLCQYCFRVIVFREKTKSITLPCLPFLYTTCVRLSVCLNFRHSPCLPLLLLCLCEVVCLGNAEFTTLAVSLLHT